MVSISLRLRYSLLLAIAVALLSTGCSDSGSNTPPESSAPAAEVARRVAQDTTNDNTAMFVTLDPDGVIYAAPLVVRATVASVGGPFWNAADGQKWTHRLRDTDEGPRDYTTPELYREVTLEVKEILRDDHGFADEALTVFAYGGGPDTEDRNAYRNGHFTPGEEVIVFLARQAFFMRESSLVVHMPFYGAAGVYHIEDGKVISDTVLTLRENTDPSDPDALNKEAETPYPSIEEFLDMISRSRDDTNADYESYRPPAGSADARREFVEEVISTTTPEEGEDK